MTRRSLVVRASAEQDIVGAVAWYDVEAPGMSERFLSEVEAALARIEAWPSIGPSVERSVRCVPLRRLPWRVYYELDDTRFEVIAVLHAKRGTEAISDALDRDE